MDKKSGFEFYESLGKPVNIVAPMVDASELAWRMLSRKYGAHLCFTPMLHAGVFVRDKKYRVEALQTCPEDRPLIVQFCANDPDIFLEAVNLALEEIEFDGVDLNLGCPQVIARRGHFGSFLQDEWELLHKMVSNVHTHAKVPVTVKVRVFPDVERTLEYAKMLESAGAQMITVHGRTREQKGPLTGLADWSKIAAVKKVVKIPVVANGNIQYLSDVTRCVKETGVEGVMTAEGNLTNPALFAGINPTVWDMCLEYLDLATEYPCPLSFARGHLFKMLHHMFQIRTNADLREIIAKGQSLKDFRRAVTGLKDRYIAFHNGEKEFTEPEELKIFNLKHPPWICQPMVRPPPEVYLEKMRKIAEEEKRERELNKDSENISDETKRTADDAVGDNDEEISKTKRKKMEKKAQKDRWKKINQMKADYQSCSTDECNNPCSKKCPFLICRKCCKTKSEKEIVICEAHKIFVRNLEKPELPAEA